MKKYDSSKTGFTIVEVLVVILMISLLAVIVVPRFTSSLGTAKQKSTKAMIAKLEIILDKFYVDCERYPTQTEGLEILMKAPATLSEKWKGPYARESELKDGWGNPIKYIIPGQINPNKFDLVSYGQDGQQGGEGDNEDLFND